MCAEESEGSGRERGATDRIWRFVRGSTCVCEFLCDWDLWGGWIFVRNFVLYAGGGQGG